MAKTINAKVTRNITLTGSLIEYHMLFQFFWKHKTLWARNLLLLKIIDLQKNEKKKTLHSDWFFSVLKNYDKSISKGKLWNTKKTKMHNSAVKKKFYNKIVAI